MRKSIAPVKVPSECRLRLAVKLWALWDSYDCPLLGREGWGKQTWFNAHGGILVPPCRRCPEQGLCPVKYFTVWSILQKSDDNNNNNNNNR